MKSSGGKAMDLSDARALLESRIEIVKESATRSRYALAVNVAASTALLSVLFNTYFSWTRIAFAYSHLPAQGFREGTTKLLREQVLKAWVDSQTFSVPILGIKIWSNDVTIVGSLVLGVLCVWMLFCARREHLSLAGILSDSLNFLRLYENGTAQERADRLVSLYYIYTGVTSQFIFTVLSDDRPVSSIVPDAAVRQIQPKAEAPQQAFFRSMAMIDRMSKQVPADSYTSAMSHVLRVLVQGMYYLPVIAVVGAGLLEAATIFTTAFHSPYRPPLDADKVTTWRHALFLVIMGLLCVFNAVVCGRVGATVSRYNLYGRAIIREVGVEIIRLAGDAGMFATTPETAPTPKSAREQEPDLELGGAGG
ncbi:MAG: hypothetical protein QM820_58130 [Minicystis sp.]